MAPNLHVVAGAGPDGNARVRKIRDGHEQRGALLLDGVDLHLEVPDLLRTGLVGGKNGRRIESLPLGARHLVARCILLALQSLHFRNEAPPARFGRRDLLEIGVGVEAASTQPHPDGFEVIAHVRGVEHA